MGNLGYFNPDTVEDAAYSLLPVGEYVVMITESEVKESKTNASNSYLNLKLQVAKGDYQGRVLFLRLNLWNSNETAKNIADRQLKDIYRALNVTKVQDSSQLHDKPFVVKVKIKPDMNGEERNEVGAILWKKTNKGEAAAVKAVEKKIAVELDSDDIPF
jgi:hypothetical protein